MTTHRESRIIRASRERIFDLVADVERYPEFLPLWIDARVQNREGDTYYTEQEVGLGPIRERFHTRTVLARPTRIEVRSADGLFRDFSIRWTFSETKHGCRTAVALKWEVRSWLLQRAIDLMLPETARTMVQAFERRAQEQQR